MWQVDQTMDTVRTYSLKFCNTVRYHICFSDMYEISPYATFQVGGPHRPAVASTLDHTLQFRTFGHMENESPPLQAPCRRHFPQKSNRHDISKGFVPYET